MTLLTERLKAWFEDEGSVANYREAIHLLQLSGVFDILRRVGIPVVFDNGENRDVMAGQAHFSAGYQTAIDQLQYFEQMFAVSQQGATMAPPDFGAESEALRRGHLRPEDL